MEHTQPSVGYLAENQVKTAALAAAVRDLQTLARQHHKALATISQILEELRNVHPSP